MSAPTAAPNGRRRYLVIARAGDNSLHRRYLGNTRNFDLYIAYFGAERGRYSGDGEYYVAQGGFKYGGIAQILQSSPELLDRYDAFWFPDDDLDISCADVCDMFALFSGRSLDLAQPALTPDSSHTYPALLQHRGFTMRYTNFVEVMAPAFSSAALQECLPTFSLNESSWGLDMAWRHILGPRGSLGVLDAVPMRHTREVGGGALYGSLKQAPEDDLRAIMARYNVRHITADPPRTLSAVMPGGRRVAGVRLTVELLLRFPWRQTSARTRRSYAKHVVSSALEQDPFRRTSRA